MIHSVGYLREAELARGLFENDMNAEVLYASMAQRYGENPTLKKIAQRINNARAIVYQLGQRFLSKNDAAQQRELFKFVYGKKSPELYAVRQNGFALEFEVAQKELTEEAKGEVIIDPEGIDIVLERGEIHANKHNVGCIGSIAYLLAYGMADIDTTRQHELKHVMDNIAGTDIALKETSADLYAGTFSIESIARDAETIKKRLGREEETLSRMRAMHVPPKAREGREQKIAKLNKELLAVHKLPIELIQELLTREKEIFWKDLSFLVTLTPTTELERRLTELEFQT